MKFILFLAGLVFSVFLNLLPFFPFLLVNYPTALWEGILITSFSYSSAYFLFSKLPKYLNLFMAIVLPPLGVGSFSWGYILLEVQRNPMVYLDGQHFGEVVAIFSALFGLPSVLIGILNSWYVSKYVLKSTHAVGSATE